jgi:hypothetical protein
MGEGCFGFPKLPSQGGKDAPPQAPVLLSSRKIRYIQPYCEIKKIFEHYSIYIQKLSI